MSLTGICKDVFRAIHEGKWLSIEYNNQNSERTRYWIAVKDIHAGRRTLKAEGLHLEQMTAAKLIIYLDSIAEARTIEGSYYRIRSGSIILMPGDIIISRRSGSSISGEYAAEYKR